MLPNATSKEPKPLRTRSISILSLLSAVLILASCAGPEEYKYSSFRTKNLYSSSEPMGGSAVLGLTLTVTFSSGAFNMISLPIPAYNEISGYTKVVTAKVKKSLLGGGEQQNATQIQLTVKKVFSFPTYTVFSPAEGIGPPDSTGDGYWDSGNHFLITFDGDTAVLTRE